MMTKIKKFIATVGATLTLLMPALIPATAMAADTATTPGLCGGATLTVDGDCAEVSGSEGTINKILGDVINIFSLVVGIISVIMIIIGGLKYITSSGDSGNVTAAKNTIIYAVIGLVVVALAQIIVKFVLNRVTSSAN